MTEHEDLIKAGDYVVVQRQSFIKLHKLKANGTVALGKDIVELENVIDKPYFSTFRMVTRPKNRRVYSLELSAYTASIQNLTIDKSGVDNRDIIDDGNSQQLSTEEITKLRDGALSSSEIVDKLISNSKTFGEKTEYSQEKYLKKKEKKYFEFIQIRRPSIRLIAEIYYKQDPGKVLGIRLDDLSQILAYSNVQNDSKVLLYDSGTSGLLPAAVTHKIGANTTGTLVHMHPGNVCQKEAFQAMHFPQEQNDRCVNVCLYSVLRCFYQEKSTSQEKTDTAIIDSSDELKCNEKNENNKPDELKYNENIENDQQDEFRYNKKNENDKKDELRCNEKNENNKRKCPDIDGESRPAKRACWQVDNEKACKVLQDKIDSLIIVAKEHPSNIVKELIQFLGDGKPFVIFNLLRESLVSLYFELKNRTDIISLRLTSTMMRNYQVLPNRTHPDVNMTCGGYILTGFKINTKQI